jgi:hypothetical protein
LLRLPQPTLVKRIDYVMTSGDLHAISARIVGHRRIGRPREGSTPVVWASDHAGIVAQLLIPPARE